MDALFVLCFCFILPFVLVIFLASSLFIVEQQTVAVIERFGRFVRVARAGLNFKIPLIETIAGRLSLRVLQLDVKAETKTLDNVFVNVIVSVQYFVLNDRVFDAFYKLNSPDRQINSYVFDVVRARVPTMNLDDLFEKKDEIALAVKNELNETMREFGFEILNALVTDIEPDKKVKDAMNEINAAQRLRVAAAEKGEADRILKVKAAQAEAESKALQGKGIADQRKAIIDGLRESVEHFNEGVNGATTQDIMTLVMLTQYFDTLKDLGHSANTTTILLPHSPSGVSDISDQIRNAVIVGNKVSETTKSGS
ncbi:SPFH domain-containing protein [Candidatus Dojkabacteria bacterium]|uniref:SPFH domain-containing protein n=1 Tax=Candidatus Dojkabacteria bacterium TaxID=2099670 RepID=A0A3M0Z103_9BACT|nr:MAG: SPFH domain-containing protein [Candidatus Dojkabacteria bacterium]